MTDQSKKNQASSKKSKKNQSVTIVFVSF